MPCLNLPIIYLFPVYNHLIDRRPQPREPLLILGHDVSFIHLRIVVKVVCKLLDMPACRLNLLNGEVEQYPVVRLELQLSVLFKYLIIARKELS